MKIQYCIVLAASLCLAGCDEKTGQPGSSTNAVSSGNPLDAPADYLGALAKGQQAAVKTVDVSTLKEAIQLFNVDKGRNPKDLNELVTEKFMPRIPAAPYGTKIVYDPVAGTVAVVKAQ